MKPNLIFGDPDLERVKLLQQGFQSHPQITARALKPHEVRTLPNLDAFYLSIMGAERWGARPIIHEAQVLRTTPEDRTDGWPPFVIAGGAFKPEEAPLNERIVLRVVISAVLKAVEMFNAEKNEVIQSIGFEPFFTGIDKLPPLEAARIICAAYDENVGRA